MIAKKAKAELQAVFRDFTGYQADGGHPDFFRFGGSGQYDCVKSDLNADSKPELSGKCGYSQGYTGADNFLQWYSVDTPAIARSLEFTWDNARELYSYDSSNFFPVDGTYLDGIMVHSVIIV